MFSLKMEESDSSDIVRYEKYISVMTDVLVNKKYAIPL